MDPGCAVVGNAVAAGVRSYESLLLASVEFTLGRVNGVDVCGGRAFIAGHYTVLVRNSLPTDVFPADCALAGIGIFSSS